VRQTGVENIARHEREMANRAARRIQHLAGIHLFMDGGFQNQTGVLSFRVEDRNCEELGEALAQRGVALRAGLQCAPLAHRTAGTLETGTLRLSTSAFTTPGQVDRFAWILESVIRENARF
jgi:selenocysteine lyase/cysteine desulfurase